MFGKKEKKKRSCLGRIIRFAIFGVIALVALVWLLDDEDYDYISDEEISSGEDDISLEDLLDSFFDYYGYYPDELDDSDYYYSDYYDDEDYATPEVKNLVRSHRSGNNDYSYDDSNNQNYDYDDSYDEPVREQPKAEEPKVAKKDNSSASSSSGTSDATINRFVEVAKSYLGTPYVWGGNSRSGIDCSGLVYNAALESGLGNLPRTAKTLCGIASRIDKSELTAGDLVFFSSSGSISHVAIYIGNNQILHAVSEGSKTGVITSKLNQKYWKEHYYSSGRIRK